MNNKLPKAYLKQYCLLMLKPKQEIKYLVLSKWTNRFTFLVFDLLVVCIFVLHNKWHIHFFSHTFLKVFIFIVSLRHIVKLFNFVFRKWLNQNHWREQNIKDKCQRTVGCGDWIQINKHTLFCFDTFV